MMNARLKELRLDLNLTQDFVAQEIGLNRSALSDIETNKRKVSAEEVSAFSKLYNVSADYIINGINEKFEENIYLTRKFDELTEKDKKEILSLIDFKNRYRDV